MKDQEFLGRRELDAAIIGEGFSDPPKKIDPKQKFV